MTLSPSFMKKMIYRLALIYILTVLQIQILLKDYLYYHLKKTWALEKKKLKGNYVDNCMDV